MADPLPTRTWPYGTQHRGRVHSSREGRVNGQPVHIQIVVDLTVKEGHVLLGSGDPAAKPRAEGTLTFCEGGPTGGYWKFERDGANSD